MVVSSDEDEQESIVSDEVASIEEDFIEEEPSPVKVKVKQKVKQKEPKAKPAPKKKVVEVLVSPIKQSPVYVKVEGQPITTFLNEKFPSFDDPVDVDEQDL